MNKKGNSDFEKIVAGFFGVIVILIILTSGIVKDIFGAFSVLGTLGGLLGFLFIIMIVLSIWEAFNRK